MANFIRSLCITICTALFNFIPTLYKLFYDLASNHELFSSETIDTFSRNIYVLVSVVMLFAFAVKAIESIINPDMLFDSKKGFASVIKRSVIALVLIVAIPFGFELFYKFQDEVMRKSLIEKIIIGVAINEDGNGTENLAEKSGAGDMLSSTALSSVLYPAAKDTCIEYEDSDVCTKYNDAIEDISKLYKLIPDINEKVDIEGEEEYALTYEGFGLLSILVGVVLIYMLVLFCIDTALRLVKMAFLEITAPISVVAYIFGGNDILKNWFKEVKGTAFSLFGRVAALALMIFILSKLPEFVDNNFEGLEGKIINLLIIMATLMFVKEAPNMIERVFGIKIGGKGGISGRLGSMAGVGNVAKSAWDKIVGAGKALGTLGAIGTAGALGLAATGIGKGIGKGAQALDNNFLGGKGQQLAESLKGKATNVVNGVKSSNFGQQAGRLGRVASAGLKAGGTTAAIKAANQAYKDDKLTKYKKDERQNEKDEEFFNRLNVDPIRGNIDNGVSARTAFDGLRSDVSSNKKLPQKTSKALDDKFIADYNKNHLEKLKSNHTDAVDGIKSLANNALTIGDNQLSQDLNGIASQLKSGTIDTITAKSALNNLALKGKIDPSNTQDIFGKLDGIEHLVSNDIEGGAVSSLVRDGKVSAGAIAGAISTADKVVDAANKSVDGEKEVASASVKQEIENYVKASDDIIRNDTKESNKQGTKSQVGVGPIPSNNSSSNNSNSSASTQNSGTNNNGQTIVTPTGDGNYNTSSGIPGSAVKSNPSTYDVQPSGGNINQSTSTGSSQSTYNNLGNNSSEGNSSSQDLSGFFDGLSKDIRDANAATNSILNDQLKTQQSSLNESKKQNTTLNNISSGVNNLNNTVGEMNSNIKSFSNTNNKNLKDISQKLDDNNTNNNE